MAERPTAEPPTAEELIPGRPTLASLRAAAAGCRACELWTKGTQTVFGEGPPRTSLLLVGEQPGDREDRTGHPFVGPAGSVLDEALAEAGIDRADAYVTNAVKHFNWELRGRRRIHRRPGTAHIHACRPWLQAEIAVVHPKLVLLLGATAAQAVLGRDFRLTEHRGELVDSDLDALVAVTVHPSSILRARDREARRSAQEAFVRDLRVVEAALRR